MTYTVWKKKKNFAVGTTDVGDLFIGYLDRPTEIEFFKDTAENKEMIINRFEFEKQFA